MKPFKAILTVLSLAIVPFISVQAAKYTLDLRSATPESAEEPVLRRASMPVAIGTIPAVSVGDSIDLRLFDDVQFALSIVSAPLRASRDRASSRRTKTAPPPRW